jgi:hypothetical protein
MAKQSNHLPPLWIEYLYVGANEDYSNEMVISRCVPEKDAHRELTKIFRELRDKQFENLIHSSRKVVKNQNSNFNRVSIIPSTRDLVVLYIEYTEVFSGNRSEPKQLMRIVRIKDLQDSILKGIESVRKHPNRQYTRYVIKEYCDSERVKRILWAHFGK